MASKTTKDGKRKPQYNPETKRIEWVTIGTEAGTEAGTESRGSTANMGEQSAKRIWQFKKPAETTGTEAGTKTGTEAGTQTGTEAGTQTGTEAGTQTGTEKKRRGRKPGSTSQTSSRPLDKVDLAKLSKQIQGFHAIAATVTKNPVLMIDEQQGTMLASSIMGIASQYEMTINPRTLAWIDLIATAGIIYGPKVFIILSQKKPKANVTPLRSIDPFNLATMGNDSKPPQDQ